MNDILGRLDTSDVLDRLDAIVAAVRATSLPDVWLDAGGVGAILSYTPRVVRERISLRADFPRPLRIDGVGNPRWKRSEVLQWADEQRTA